MLNRSALVISVLPLGAALFAASGCGSDSSSSGSNGGAGGVGGSKGSGGAPIVSTPIDEVDFAVRFATALCQGEKSCCMSIGGVIDAPMDCS
ncbi:MAG TPA: hypothetical protein VFQ35_00325, partial [Polyangiaceae bacterium]|nr:hypothetical protein [Polyangiaceae bacterium]